MSNQNKNGNSKQRNQGQRPGQQKASKQGGKSKGGPNHAGGTQGQKRNVPIARDTVVKTSKPKMMTLPNGDCRISYREYIGDIVSSATVDAFAITALTLNPSIAASHPWLSKIALNFESYRYDKVKVCFETESPTTTGGTVMIAVDYDADDSVPTSKVQMMNYRGSVRAAPWNDCCHVSLSEDLHKRKTFFVRAGQIVSTADPRLYDTGIIYIASQGVSLADFTLGEVYIEYTVLLMTPQYETNAQGGELHANATATNTLTNYFGTPTTVGGVILIQQVPASLNQFTFGPLVTNATYIGFISLTGGSTMTGTLNLTAGSGMISLIELQEPAQTLANALSIAFQFVAIASNASFSLSGLTAIGSVGADFKLALFATQ